MKKLLTIILLLLATSCVVHQKVAPPIQKGMNEWHVKQRIGEPHKVTTYEARGVRYTTWFYPCRFIKKNSGYRKECDYLSYRNTTYVEFQDGRVTGIEW